MVFTCRETRAAPGGDLQESQAKHSSESELLASRYSQPPYHWHGQEQDDEVGHDVADRAHPPTWRGVRAIPIYRLVPEKLDGDAGNDANQHLGCKPAADKSHDAHIRHAQWRASAAYDAVELEEECRLGEELAAVGQYQADVQQFLCKME